MVVLLLTPLHSQPSKTDIILGYGGAALLAGSEYLFKDYLTPDTPNWTETNSFDIFFRDKLKWDNENLKTGKFLSDLFAKGIIIPSILWTPLMTDYKYSHSLLLNIQVIAATGILINTTKFIIARQRPYSFFNTFPSNGADDYLSFFSAHTAFPFAVTTATSNVLQNRYPHQSAAIWSSGVALSLLCGYLRIAADHHYMSDVLTGMIVGLLTGYFISEHQKTVFFRPASGVNFNILNFSIPL
jgi:membrane-associated phospholipid phosphatase